MYSLRSYQFIVILTLGCLQVGICQDKPGGPSEGAPSATELNTELKVFREALYKGSVDSATVLLIHPDPNARILLLNALKQSENSPARIAVCNALIKARVQKETIRKDGDFIEPLLVLFASEVAAEADSAVKATLVFEYEKISSSLEKLVKDTSKPFKTRANAIQAFKLRRDLKATIRLIELIKEMAQTDKQITAEAKMALSGLGITIGDKTEDLDRKIEEIKKEGESDFLRTQLTRQEAQADRERAELDFWKRRYLLELDKRYKQISDEKAKSDFLIEYLRDEEAVVRLWALDKTYQWRLVSSQLPDPLGPVLIGLISDDNRNIRLNTAELLALMQRLNSAQSLLDQHQKEPDDQVKTKLFVALGAACSSAISGPPADIPVTIKKIRSTTLELATKHYLFSESDEKARYAAGVIRKLLVRNGLESEDVNKYLNLLSTRYNDEKDKPNAALRGVLLNAMAGLCAPESTCRTKALNLFRPQFIEALQDKDNYVRETAVNGLSYIDKKVALEHLRPGFYNDPSEALRKKLIALAGEEGNENDLNNLADKIGKNSEGELAWQAMMNIFRRLDESKVAVWKEWIGKLTSENGGYSNEQRIAFFKNAEAKAPGATKLEARRNLGDLYYSAGQFESAADYFDKLYEAAQKPQEKDVILKKLLDASLKGDQLGRVTALVGNHLSKSDLDPNSVIIPLLDGHLGKPPLGANQKSVIKALEEIKVSQGRPMWRKWLDGWKAIMSKDEEDKEPEKPKPTTG